MHGNERPGTILGHKHARPEQMGTQNIRHSTVSSFSIQQEVHPLKEAVFWPTSTPLRSVSHQRHQQGQGDFGPLIARFIAANASGRRPVYGTAAAFCSLSIGASGQAPLHQTAQRGLTRARRRPCSHRRWRRGCCRTCRHRPARGRQRRLQPGRRPAWCWDDSPWPAPAYRHR